MPEETPTSSSSLIPRQPLPDGAADFVEKVHGLLDRRPKVEATVARSFEGMESMFDLIAAGLYSLASMLVGEGEDSIRLVETAVANAEVSSGSSAEEARLSSRLALATAAVEMLAKRNPEGLAAPTDLEHAVT